MRIVAGSLGGRRIAAPSGRETRPTSDRVREATFSRLVSVSENVVGARVLDLYAGSGALGLEALSRGASHATFVEKSRNALSTLRANIEALGVEGCTKVVTRDVGVASRTGPLPGSPFSLLFADPPYRINASEVGEVFALLVAGGHVEHDALVVWEHDSRDAIEWPAGFLSLGARQYGSTAVDIARFVGDTEA